MRKMQRIAALGLAGTMALSLAACGGSGDSTADTASTAELSLIHISEPTRLGMISDSVFCLKKKKNNHDLVCRLLLDKRRNVKGDVSDTTKKVAYYSCKYQN